MKLIIDSHGTVRTPRPTPPPTDPGYGIDNDAGLFYSLIFIVICLGIIAYALFR